MIRYNNKEHKKPFFELVKYLPSSEQFYIGGRNNTDLVLHLVVGCEIEIDDYGNRLEKGLIKIVYDFDHLLPFDSHCSSFYCSPEDSIALFDVEDGI